jgi:endonuclease/exonuclease/phosphatase family metal-dependent hydrolase
MGQFSWFLNDATLQEIHLSGRMFTWSNNERLHPTLERIDRAFMSNELEAPHPSCDLQSLSSLCSDHTPLLLTLDVEFVAQKQ